MVTVVVADEERVFADALTSLLGGDADLNVLPALSSPDELDRVVAGPRPHQAVVSRDHGAW
jgi:hypothetical protein